METQTRTRLVSAGGVVGSLMLFVYFGLPLFVKGLGHVLYAANPTNAAVVEAGRRYHELIYVGTWIQAIGALLMVVFLLALADGARGRDRVAVSAVRVGCAVLLAIVLFEGLTSLTWASAAVHGQVASSRTSFDLNGEFGRIYPLIAVPLISIGLGILLRASDVLPGAFARLSFVIGGAFVIGGFVGVVAPAAAGVVGALGGLQALWILAAAIAFGRAQHEPELLSPELDRGVLSDASRV